jgi:hypothetical protein
LWFEANLGQIFKKGAKFVSPYLENTQQKTGLVEWLK